KASGKKQRKRTFARAVGIHCYILDERLTLLLPGRRDRGIREDLDCVRQVRQCGERPRQRAAAPCGREGEHGRGRVVVCRRVVQLDTCACVPKNRVSTDQVLLATV